MIKGAKEMYVHDIIALLKARKIRWAKFIHSHDFNVYLLIPKKASLRDELTKTCNAYKELSMREKQVYWQGLFRY